MSIDMKKIKKGDILLMNKGSALPVKSIFGVSENEDYIVFADNPVLRDWPADREIPKCWLFDGYGSLRTLAYSSENNNDIKGIPVSFDRYIEDVVDNNDDNLYDDSCVRLDDVKEGDILLLRNGTHVKVGNVRHNLKYIKVWPKCPKHLEWHCFGRKIEFFRWRQCGRWIYAIGKGNPMDVIKIIPAVDSNESKEPVKEEDTRPCVSLGFLNAGDTLVLRNGDKVYVEFFKYVEPLLYINKEEKSWRDTGEFTYWVNKHPWDVIEIIPGLPLVSIEGLQVGDTIIMRNGKRLKVRAITKLLGPQDGIFSIFSDKGDFGNWYYTGEFKKSDSFSNFVSSDWDVVSIISK